VIDHAEGAAFGANGPRDQFVYRHFVIGEATGKPSAINQDVVDWPDDAGLIGITVPAECGSHETAVEDAAGAGARRTRGRAVPVLI
jgi:hypothetical protein